MTAAEVDERNLDGMRKLLARKRERQQQQKPPRPTATSDQRKYGKRGWTWTP
jgi:hypothetical protein